MGETLAIAALEGSLHWGAAVAFMDPLRHRSRYPARAAAGLAGCILLALLLSPLGQEQWALPRRLIMGLLVAIIMWFCTRLSFWGAGYCAVLAEISCQMVYELWMTFQMWAFHGSTLPWRQYWWVNFFLPRRCICCCGLRRRAGCPMRASMTPTACNASAED